MRVTNQILFAMVSAVLAGCVNTNGVSGKRFAPINLNASGVLDGSNYQNYMDGGRDSAFSCPSDYNVEPDYDWNFDEVHSNHYTVCRKKSDGTKLKIYGTTRDSNMVCAIPVNIQGTMCDPKYLAYLDTATPPIDGLPSSQVLDTCFSPSEQGVEISFGNVAFSHLFITTMDYEAHLKECVYSEIYSLCPRYSFGKI